MSDYREYLKSYEWEGRRWEALERGEHRCRKCGAEENLHVHHKNYDNLGEEKPEDLEVLCKYCHADIHGKPIKAKEQRRVYHISEIIPKALFEYNPQGDNP